MTKKRKALFESLVFYAKYLRIDKKDVTVNLVFKYMLEKTFNEYANVEHVNARRINITFDADFNGEFALQKMAHEMVHVAQYLKGTLSVDSDGYQLWKGKKVSSKLTWRECPWEIEAMKKEVIMVHAYCAAE